VAATERYGGGGMMTGEWGFSDEALLEVTERRKVKACAKSASSMYMFMLFASSKGSSLAGRYGRGVCGLWLSFGTGEDEGGDDRGEDARAMAWAGLPEGQSRYRSSM